jgi:hypothetical protein
MERWSNAAPTLCKPRTPVNSMEKIHPAERPGDDLSGLNENQNINKR